VSGPPGEARSRPAAGGPVSQTAPADGQTVLKVEGLCKRYGDYEALADVSFEAHAGELVAVVGPNGAGKTTLLSILAGVQRPTAGTIDRPAGALGWVPQEPAVYSKLSVAENLRLFARLERIADVEATVQRMLDQTGLHARAAERLERLSGGNRQRVNVAVGLLVDPPVALLDEPSSALDPGQRERLWQFVAGLAAKGRCIVFSTHIVSEAARHAHRLLVLDEGRLLLDGTPAELAQAAGVPGDFERAFVAFLAGHGAPRQPGDRGRDGRERGGGERGMPKRSDEPGERP
jgi:ABC-2 type transport system ATP-binding protein